MGSELSERAADDVLAAVARERQAVAEGDAEGYLSTLTDDAVFLPPASLPKRGAELHAWLSAFVRGFQVEWLSFSSSEVLVSGDLAYHAYAYSWRVTPRAGGEPTVATGKGVHLLRRQLDGSWKIAREIWNASPPATK